MLGTIESKESKERFIQGVYNFPALDNPVWYVTEKDLRYIFDDHIDNERIDYQNDFYLPIGTSPAFSGYNVKICPDQFFVKHGAILGNTGSGKSCTLTSILRSLFNFKFPKGCALNNAHIVILDTNGEYKSAFLPSDYSESKKDELEAINAYYYGGEEKVQIPYWFMDWADFSHLLHPSEGTQAPVLNRAIGLAKNEHESLGKNLLPQYLQNDIQTILDSSSENIKKRTGYIEYGNWNYKENNEISNIGSAVSTYSQELGDVIIKLSSQENFNNAELQDAIRKEIRKYYENATAKKKNETIISERNIDLPTWFSYQELCKKFIDNAIEQEGHSNNRIREFISTLRLRMNSFLNDKRMAIPLMLKDTSSANHDILAEFISFVLGDFNKHFADKTEKSYIGQYNDSVLEYKKDRNTNQITIVDVSLLPFEVLDTITALLGRLIIQFVSCFMPKDRGKYPIVIVLEEAQNYISEKRDTVAKEVFERIAREGRKYGISLIVCSQRPSELSRTVLSQCNSYIIHRLQNPEDQRYVKGLVSSANTDLLDQLPIIPQQHVIITGDCVRTPIQVRINNVSPTPNSDNPKYVERWLDKDMKIPYEETCNRWLGRSINRKEE